MLFYRERGTLKTGFGKHGCVVEGSCLDLVISELLTSCFDVYSADNPAHLGATAAAYSVDQSSEDLTPKDTRARFICEQCDLKAWARYSAKLDCGRCHLPLIAT